MKVKIRGGSLISGLVALVELAISLALLPLQVLGKLLREVNVNITFGEPETKKKK